VPVCCLASPGRVGSVDAGASARSSSRRRRRRRAESSAVQGLPGRGMHPRRSMQNRRETWGQRPFPLLARPPLLVSLTRPFSLKASPAWSVPSAQPMLWEMQLTDITRFLPLLAALRVSPPSSDGSQSASSPGSSTTLDRAERSLGTAREAPSSAGGGSSRRPVHLPWHAATFMLTPNFTLPRLQEVSQDHLARRGGRPAADPGWRGRGGRRHPGRHLGQEPQWRGV